MSRLSSATVFAGIMSLAFLPHGAAIAQVAASQPAPQTEAALPAQVTLENAKFACPMETHPDEADPSRQGAYLALEPGKCEWCGMTLKPADELDWVRARRAAQGGEVAYTCQDHQHVFSKAGGSCPRCKNELRPFKMMYTCPNPEHSTVVRAAPGTCPKDGRTLVPFRGVWLSPEMSNQNVPPESSAARSAPYHCSLHPLVASDVPADCPICARELVPTETAGAAAQPRIPSDAAYVCPMQECGQFSSEAGKCPTCGMRLKPIDDVAWAKSLREQAARPRAADRFVCPMHPDIGAAERGACSVCGMQLVAAEALPKPADAPAAIRMQMDFLLEHYLELHRRLAADSERDVALHALGLVGAADEVLKQVKDPKAALPSAFLEAVTNLRSAALKLTGKSLQEDRVTFAALGGALREMVTHVRPTVERFPKIYIFHCPMTKGDWLQTTDDMANPFYGFAMLKCGELAATK